MRQIQFIVGLKDLKISHLKKIDLKDFEVPLKNAINEKKIVNITIDLSEPEEILKGTYIAETLSKQGYVSTASISNNELNWKCTPSP